MRSLLWATIYKFLLFELTLTFVLCVPVPRKWRNWICGKVSSLELKRRLKIPLLTMFCTLSFALLDAASYLSEASQHQRAKEHGSNDNNESVFERHLEKERIYKTGRNMYLAGFALTLLFVINRIAELMQEHADLEGELENYKLAVKMQSVETSAAVTAAVTARQRATAPPPRDDGVNDDGEASPVGLETLKPLQFKKED